jgi:hypothetical protein
MKLTLPKVGTWSCPRLPKIQSLIARVKTRCNQSVIYTIGKVLKCRCPKWPRMSHLDIYSPSYGQKKGRKSNWQFDSQPLKVKNWPNPDVCRRIVTWRWKDLEESYNISLDLIPIEGLSKKLWMPKVPGVQPRTISGLLLGSPGKKMSFGCKPRGELQRILYGGRWWLPPSSSYGESSESKVARGLSQHQKGAKWVLTNLWLVLDAWLSN